MIQATGPSSHEGRGDPGIPGREESGMGKLHAEQLSRRGRMPRMEKRGLQDAQQLVWVWPGGAATVCPESEEGGVCWAA
jgi:hypothetical protein